MNTLLQDLRFGFRLLAKNGGFTAVAIITLALGIGANTAIFSITNAVLLRDLPVREPQRLAVFGGGLNEGVAGGNFPRSADLYSYLQYKQLLDHNQVFQGLCAFSSTSGGVNVKSNGAGGPAEQAQAELVSGNFFAVLGVNAFLGRTFTPEEDRVAGAHPVAVISYRYWTKAFSRRPSVIGRTIDVNNTSFTIIGVTPPEFFGTKPIDSPPDMWLPLTMQPQVTLQQSMLNAPDTFWLTLLGRLKPGINMREAQAGVNLLPIMQQAAAVASMGVFPASLEIRTVVNPASLTPEVRRAIAEIDKNLPITGVKTLEEQVSGSLNQERMVAELSSFFGALALLLACVGLYGLMSYAVTRRTNEIGIRMALGAQAKDVLWMVMREVLLIVGLGVAVGVPMALAGGRLISSLLYDLAPSDPATMVIAPLVLFLVAILAGYLPARRATQIEPLKALRYE